MFRVSFSSRKVHGSRGSLPNVFRSDVLSPDGWVSVSPNQKKVFVLCCDGEGCDGKVPPKESSGTLRDPSRGVRLESSF